MKPIKVYPSKVINEILSYKNSIIGNCPVKPFTKRAKLKQFQYGYNEAIDDCIAVLKNATINMDISVPRSPEDIVKEFKEMIDGSYHTKIEDMENDVMWLRSALASYALYLEGKMPLSKESREGDWHREEDFADSGFNEAINECKSILRSEAEEVTKGV